MRPQRRGQTDQQVAGCVAQVVAIVVAFLILFLVGGSFRTEVSLRLTPGVQGETITFEEQMKARHWLGGLIKGKQPDLNEVLRKYTMGGDRISEITIDTRHSFGDCVVTVITLSIYSPVTVTVSGTVVSSVDAEPAEEPEDDNITRKKGSGLIYAKHPEGRFPANES